MTASLDQWEFTAYLMRSGTRWGWTCIDAASGRSTESTLTFPSYDAAVTNAATHGFNRSKHRFLLAAVEQGVPCNHHSIVPKLPAWPAGIVVV